MSTVRKENSTVRFAKGTKTLAQLTHMYKPELHRQVTERIPVSRLGQELGHLCQRGLGEAFDAGAMAQAKLELTELVDKVMLSLRRNRAGLDLLAPVVLHCFSHWHVHPVTTVVCLIPVTFPKAKLVQRDIGHVLIKLPSPPPAPSKTTSHDATTPAATTSTTNHHHHHNNHTHNSSNTTNSALSNESQTSADVRTKDGMYVSPRKLHTACTQLVRNCLLKHGLDADRITISSGDASLDDYDDGGLSMFVALDCGWRAEFVPCVAVTTTSTGVNGLGGGGRGGGGGRRGHRRGTVADVETGVYYVSRPFQAGMHEKGDITWRPCFSAREQDLLHSISSTDNGVRLQAMYAICRLLSRDWRLEHFTCYDIQTVLLHDMDFHVDYSPRWQRNTLESCVRSMMKTLLYFVDRENLPHFDMNQLNLWGNKTPRQMSMARGALSRLLNNENAFISLVRRAALGDASTARSVDFGFG